MLINSGTELEAALRRLDEIWSARPGDADWTERCSLIDAIEQYENTLPPIPPPDPVDAILFRLEQARLGPEDLVQYLGSTDNVDAVLNHGQALSTEAIWKLHIGLGIPLASLRGAKPQGGAP